MALPEEPLPRAARMFDSVQVQVRWPGVWAGFLIGPSARLTRSGLPISPRE